MYSEARLRAGCVHSLPGNRNGALELLMEGESATPPAGASGRRLLPPTGQLLTVRTGCEYRELELKLCVFELITGKCIGRLSRRAVLHENSVP
jgi:hypothetical protein